MIWRLMTLALSVALFGTAIAVSHGYAQRPISSDGDRAARSRASFDEMAKVIQSPRCLNCHPVTRQPLQGDDSHRHVPDVNLDTQSAAFNCQTCHHDHNSPVFGGGIQSIPGERNWRLAPASMAWVGKSRGDICRQIKDFSRNGHRDLAALQRHMANDPLVGWAWHPGAGHTPAPGTQATLGKLVSAWIATGAECP